MQQKETEPVNQSLSKDISRVQENSKVLSTRKSDAISNKDDGQEHANKWAVLAILAIGIFMATLDTSIVNISLPTIAHYFGVPLNGAIEWVIIAYLVVIAGVLLTTGRLADMIGRKPIWVAGLIIFTTGSAICGASVSLGMLIAARALQGLGGAFVFPVLFSRTAGSITRQPPRKAQTESPARRSRRTGTEGTPRTAPGRRGPANASGRM